MTKLIVFNNIYDDDYIYLNRLHCVCYNCSPYQYGHLYEDAGAIVTHTPYKSKFE